MHFIIYPLHSYTVRRVVCFSDGTVASFSSFSVPIIILHSSGHVCMLSIITLLLVGGFEFVMLAPLWS